MRPGTLYLVCTPIGDQEDLPPVVAKKLSDACRSDIVIGEGSKSFRRRWLRWGLPKEAIENVFYLNEHSEHNANDKALNSLRHGQSVYLISDQGTPVFCDPGETLVSKCQSEKIPVRCLNMPNSAMRALVESGFPTSPAIFVGFLPRQNEEREKALKSWLERKESCVFLETAYRRKALVQSLRSVLSEATHIKLWCYWSFEQDSTEECSVWGEFHACLEQLPPGKKNFVLVAKRGPL